MHSRGTLAVQPADALKRAEEEELQQVLDVAIALAGTDMGTLQYFDEKNDCLRIVASRGFGAEAIEFFDPVHRDTHSSCAAALSQRMTVFVEDVSTNYIFVGTKELDIIQSLGIAAVLSIPLISSNGHLRGVASMYFRQRRQRDDFDWGTLHQLAVQAADRFVQQ